MSAQNDHPEIAEDEIDLADLVAVLFRQWRWIVGFLALVLGGGVAYTVASPATVETKAILQVGHIAGEPVESPKAVAAKVRAKIESQAATSPDSSFPGESAFEIQANKAPGTVRVSLKTDADLDGEAILERLVGPIYEDQKAEVVEEKDAITKAIQGGQELIASFETQAKRMAEKDGSGEVAPLMEAVSEANAQLAKEKKNLRGTEAPEWLLRPTEGEPSSEPGWQLTLALSLVLGGFVGVFAAFLAEFWANNRDRILQQAE